MAKAIGNIEDIAQFQSIAEQCVGEMGELCPDAMTEISVYEQRITEEIERTRALRQRIEAEIERLRRAIAILDEKIIECEAILSTMDPFIEVTTVDEDGNETTEYIPNPEYEAMEAQIQELEAERAVLSDKVTRLERLLVRVEDARSRMEAAIGNLEEIEKNISEELGNATEYAERAIMLLNNIQTILGEYLAVSIDGGSGTVGAGTGNHAGTKINAPRALTKTQQGWKSIPGGTMYNSPFETGAKLISNQGSIPEYSQDCGIASCANVARLAGMKISEEKAVWTALNHTPPLCGKHTSKEAGGGTSPQSRQALLACLGVPSHLEPADVVTIAQRVQEGRGVIISVRAGRLWNSNTQGLHAITVTSVVRNSDGSLYGFFVCDSGTGGRDSAKFYTANEIQNALTPNRSMNVTSTIIR